MNLHGTFEKTLMKGALYKGVSQIKRNQQDMVKHSPPPPSNISELPLTGLKGKGRNDGSNTARVIETLGEDICFLA